LNKIGGHVIIFTRKSKMIHKGVILVIALTSIFSVVFT